jgi:hypothetical protein
MLIVVWKLFPLIFHFHSKTLGALVDVSDIPPIESCIQKKFPLTTELNPIIPYILITHKHWDAGGNEEFVKRYPGISVVGSSVDQVPACSKHVQHDDPIVLDDLLITVFHVPCRSCLLSINPSLSLSLSLSLILYLSNNWRNQ